MEQDLRRFVNDEPILARSATPIEQLARWARRNRQLATMTAVLLMLLLCTAIGASIAAVRFRVIADERKQLATAKATLADEMESERDISRTAERNARRELYSAELILAASEIERPGGIATVRRALRKWIPQVGGEEDWRGPEWHCLYGAGSPQQLMLDFSGVPMVGCCFDPSGKSLAVVGEDGFLRIFDAFKGTVTLRAQLAHAGGATDIVFSTDGENVITSGHDRTVKMWSLDGTLSRTISLDAEVVSCVRVSPNGEYLAAGTDVGLYVFNSASGEELHHLLPSVEIDRTDVDRIAALDWHPTEPLLLTISNNDNMFVWDPETGALLRDFDWLNELPEMEFWFGNKSVQWSPSGDRILASGISNAILALPKSGTRASAQIFEPEGGENRIGLWRPGGNQVIVGGESLELAVCDASDGTIEYRIRGHEGMITDMRLSSDGNRLASSSRDGTVRIWDLDQTPPREWFAEGRFCNQPRLKTHRAHRRKSKQNPDS